jgi:Ni/Co efflux regulator RcnB
MKLMSVAILVASLFTTSAFAARPAHHQGRASQHSQGKRHHPKHRHHAAKAPQKHGHASHKKARSGV